MSGQHLISLHAVETKKKSIFERCIQLREVPVEHNVSPFMDHRGKVHPFFCKNCYCMSLIDGSITCLSVLLAASAAANDGRYSFNSLTMSLYFNPRLSLMSDPAQFCTQSLTLSPAAGMLNMSSHIYAFPALSAVKDASGQGCVC